MADDIFPPKPQPKPFLSNCARCSVDHYLPIQWRKLARPQVCGDVTFTHWAPCPTNGEPLLWDGKGRHA